MKVSNGWKIAGALAIGGTAAGVCLKAVNRPAGSSLAGWLMGSVVVPALFAKKPGMEAFRSRIAENRRAGPALPSAKIAARYDFRDEVVAGRRMFRLSPKAGRSRDARILYLHGGAYVFDFTALQWSLVTGLIDRTHVEVVSPIYPLAPEHGAASGLDMVEACFTRLVAEVGASNVTIVGDSAGGGLALALAQRLRDRGLPQPAALVLAFPWLDVTLSDPDQPAMEQIDPLLYIEQLRGAGRMWAGDADPADPIGSPLFGSAEGLPPTFMVAGTHDLLLPDARRWKAKSPGSILIEYPGMFHGFMLAPIPEARRALDACAQFVLESWRS